MTKKILILLLTVLSAFLCACSAEDSSAELKIVTTVFPQYDFAQKITHGTNTSLSMILPPGSEAHSYEPTPADMINVSNCHLFIRVGGESEAWADRIIKSAGIGGDKLMSLMDTVPLLESESGHGDHSHEHSEGEESVRLYDEHVWTSPKNAILITKAITERLSLISPENAEIFSKNAEKYIGELEELDRDFESLADIIGEKTIIFGDRFPFLYLTKAYGLKYTSPFRGCSAQTEASLSEIANVMETARSEGAKTVFSVDFSNEKLANTMANEIGASVLRLYSCHTASKEQIQKGLGYIDLMRLNLENLSLLNK